MPIYPYLKKSPSPSFLMHRVELKWINPQIGKPHSRDLVPNAPCGVEIHYRGQALRLPRGLFLMHRVELKEAKSIAKIKHFLPVPNAPCGVERKQTFHKAIILFKGS